MGAGQSKHCSRPLLSSVLSFKLVLGAKKMGINSASLPGLPCDSVGSLLHCRENEGKSAGCNTDRVVQSDRQTDRQTQREKRGKREREREGGGGGGGR